jgi:hypothetical protein
MYVYGLLDLGGLAFYIVKHLPRLRFQPREIWYILENERSVPLGGFKTKRLK